MLVLLLGKPFHGQTRVIDSPRETLRLVSEVIPEKKYCPPGQCAGFSPRRETVVIYHRDRSPGLPPGAAVYHCEGYEPQPEDLELVLRTFC